jgi:hypothetical protein
MVAPEDVMAEKKTELDLKELEWQIKARARIQELMYDLYCFLEEYSEFPNEDPKRPPGEPADKQELCWTNMAWMVDAAFSLWRSAFLTDTVRLHPARAGGEYNHVCR